MRAIRINARQESPVALMAFDMVVTIVVAAL
jgi:hypothetical protein